MSQHDYDIADASGAVVRADINSVLGAIASLNSGATAPSVTFAGMLWYDTANGVVKQRNAANTAWGTPYFSGLPTLAASNVFTSGPQYMILTDNASTFRSIRRTASTMSVGADMGGFVLGFSPASGQSDYQAVRFGAIVGNATIGSESGTAAIFTGQSGGALTGRVYVKTGIYTPNAVGLDKGADSLNVSELYLDGALAIPRGHLGGLTLSNNGTDGDHDIDIAAGFAVDSTSATILSLASSLTKQIDAAWAVGTAAGGLDTGTVASDTWYHVWLIKRSDTGVVDVLFSTSASAPTMPTNYDFKRRIGAVKTDGSANILGFVQVGSTFMWKDPTLDYDVASPGTSAVTATLSTPLGVVTEAIVNLFSSSAGTYLSPLSVNDEAVSQTVAPLGTSYDTGDAHATQARVLTSTSSQIRARQITNAALRIATLGYVDQRGRDD